MEFRRIGLIWNPTKTSGFEVARELRDILAERGLSVTTGITLAHALGVCPAGIKLLQKHNNYYKRTMDVKNESKRLI